MIVSGYIVTALLIAWVWIDYYRLIDIYETEKLKFIVFVFALGGLAAYVMPFVSQLIDLELNGGILNDLFFCFLKVGFVEEISKMIPFLIFFLLFKSELNEPIDYLVFSCVSALGFSAFENFSYFLKSGPYVIIGRGILSTVGHMFDTSLIAYGIIRIIYKKPKPRIVSALLFLGFAVFSHGFYDFWLLHESTRKFGWLITLFYFLCTLSIFVTILNNALNNSSFFTYKKVVNINRTVSILLSYYFIVAAIELCLLFKFEEPKDALRYFASNIFFTTFFVGVTCVRMCRFKLIQGQWDNLTLQLPFSLIADRSTGFGFYIKIKGEEYNEALISSFFQEACFLIPISSRRSYLETKRYTFIEQKFFLKTGESLFMCKIYLDSARIKFIEMYLKPKTNGSSYSADDFPIVGVFKAKSDRKTEAIEFMTQFIFLEWAVIKPITELEGSQLMQISP
jgi:RsiW-degrading membrane proteinase PrsW (M82 family)